MLNWIVWNVYKNEFGINNLLWLICHKTKPKFDIDIMVETILWIYKEILIQEWVKNFNNLVILDDFA